MIKGKDWKLYNPIIKLEEREDFREVRHIQIIYKGKQATMADIFISIVSTLSFNT